MKFTKLTFANSLGVGQAIVRADGTETHVRNINDPKWQLLKQPARIVGYVKARFRYGTPFYIPGEETDIPQTGLSPITCYYNPETGKEEKSISAVTITQIEQGNTIDELLLIP